MSVFNDTLNLSNNSNDEFVTVCSCRTKSAMSVMAANAASHGQQKMVGVTRFASNLICKHSLNDPFPPTQSRYSTNFTLSKLLSMTSVSELLQVLLV
jgi:hypothetical protein